MGSAITGKEVINMMWIMYKIEPKGAFTELGCILIDLCCIIFICMWLIALYIDKKNRERRKAMARKARKGKIIYENSAGAVIHVYSDDTLYVYEKIHGKLIQCFEIPTVDEGVKYLKSILESEE